MNADKSGQQSRERDGRQNRPVQAGRAIIRSPRPSRGGWERQFRAMAARGDDAPLDAETQTRWDEREWEW
jgi:hypothetical protein